MCREKKMSKSWMTKKKSEQRKRERTVPRKLPERGRESGVDSAHTIPPAGVISYYVLFRPYQ